MNNKFIVIKLTDKGNINEHIKSMLKNYGAEVLEDAIQSIYSVQSLSNEILNLAVCPDDVYKRIEKQLALDIGVNLMKNKLITYRKKQIGAYTDFSAAINVLNLKGSDTNVE